MKALRKSLTLAAVTAALTTGAVVAPAASASAAEPKPAQGGMAVIDLNPSLRASGETHTKDVGGGTWTYGWNLTTGGKHCFSNYFHGSKMHSATARIAGSDNKSVEAKGITAKANKTAGSAYTCYAYWGVYDN